MGGTYRMRGGGSTQTDVEPIVGPSGCGKTTLLRVLLGQLSLSRGVLEYSFDSGKPGAFGYVSQHNSLIPWKSLLDNVSYPLKFSEERYSEEEARDRAAEAIGNVGLASAYSHRPAELSGGMQRRAMLARALVYSPQILLLDEPFSGIDLYSKDSLIDLILKLQENFSLTLAWVTHDLQDVVLMSQRTYVFRRNSKFDSSPVEWQHQLGSNGRFSQEVQERSTGLLQKMKRG